MNQGSDLGNIYQDGTIQASTGGVEIGQGLNTKIRQLVADQFALPPDAVRVMAASTDKNANCSATVASARTDLNGLSTTQSKPEARSG